MSTSPLLFKVLAADHKSVYQNFDYTPYLPTSEPGKWLPRRTSIALCESGWHFTIRPELHYRRGAEIYIAEVKGKTVIAAGDKITAASARLVEKVTPTWEWLPMYPVIRLLLAISWREANPSAALPTWANLYGANLYGANLYGADLYGANLSGADLYGANLSGADLYGANLSGANLYGADLSGADLYGANLSGANLYGADLYGANLSGADLSGANLSGANLSGADLYGANLSGADLSGANLSGARDATLPQGWKLSASGIAVRA